MPHQSLFLRKLKESLAEVDRQEERPFLLSDDWAHSDEQDFNFAAFVDGECFSPICRDADAFKFESNTGTAEGHILGNIVENETQLNSQVSFP